MQVNLYLMAVVNLATLKPAVSFPLNTREQCRQDFSSHINAALSTFFIKYGNSQQFSAIHLTRSGQTHSGFKENKAYWSPSVQLAPKRLEHRINSDASQCTVLMSMGSGTEKTLLD